MPHDVDDSDSDARARLLHFEMSVLHKCLEKRVVQYAKLNPGEAMLVAPHAGHAVLSGESGSVALGVEYFRTTTDSTLATALVLGQLGREREDGARPVT